MNYFHGVPKHALLNRKAFGNLPAPGSPYLRGFSDDFSISIPVSRRTEVRREDTLADSGMTVLMEVDETGPCLIDDPARRCLHMLNHIEYDTGSLAEEYARDRAAGLPIAVPHGYFPGDDPTRPPVNRWRSHAHLLFGNWINQIYQTTPFDPAEIGTR